MHYNLLYIILLIDLNIDPNETQRAVAYHYAHLIC